MKKILLILIASAFYVSGVQAQNGSGIIETIEGKVINQATNETIPFTNISIEGTLHGTASDEEGHFELKIPEEMENDQIQFSAVGYKTKKFPVERLFSREYSIIKLEPTTYDIEDVDIAARSKVLIRILRMASENTPYNYISGPFNLRCSYENQKTLNDTTKVSRKADILVYDKTGYSTPSKRDAFRNRKYEISNTEPDYRFSSAILNLDEILDMDWVRGASSVLNPALPEHFELKLEEETEVNGRPAWVIAFSQSSPTLPGSRDYHATAFEGKITIIKEDYTVLKIEGSGRSSKHHRQGKFLAVGPSNSNYHENVSYNFQMVYSELKPDIFEMNKTYSSNGEQISEYTRLIVKQVHITDVKELATRDYFAD